MNNLKEYLKYYYLETYLFEEVPSNFSNRGYLTPEEFFAIVIWKSNRSKTGVLNGLQESNRTVKEITSEVYLSETPEKKLEVLTKIKGIKYPIASAILTVCYPDDFTVVDYRARAALETFKVKINGNPATNTDAYLEYLEKCKELAKKQNVSLRDFDRMLWGMDFYKGEKGLKNFVSGIEE